MVWSEYFTAVGSTAASLAAVTAGYAALRYGRKATVKLEASSVSKGDVLAIKARLSITAAGVFRLHLSEDRPSSLVVTEVWALKDGGFADGYVWQMEGFLQSRFVEPGETLWITELLPVEHNTHAALLGWRVGVYVTVERRPISSAWNWDDRVFVPAPG